MIHRNPRWASLFLVVVLLSPFGCDSSGGGSTKPRIIFSPDSRAIDQETVFEHTVEVKGLDHVFYIAFDVEYDPDVIEYLSAEEGSYMNQNGADDTLFEIALADGIPGKLSVGLSRTGTAPAVSGSGPLLTLTFRATSPGTTTLSFTDPRGFRDETDQEATVDSWKEGTITVQ